uniref:GIY-YIG domain-containing protein n=1 Tax=Graphocephala atropunctata TaxID=36148 RepID=A0A1B6KJX6_9HEMI
MKRHDIDLVFRSTNIRMLLSVKNTRTNQLKSTGVYRIKCPDCPSSYIGQTGRSFEACCKEHKPDPNTNKQRSALAQHIFDNDHSMSNINDGLEVLHRCRKGNRLNKLEEFEIYKLYQQQNNKDFILNEKIQLNSNPTCYSITYWTTSHNNQLTGAP